MSLITTLGVRYHFGRVTKTERAWEANAIGIKAQLYRSVYRVFTLIYRRSPVYETLIFGPMCLTLVK